MDISLINLRKRLLFLFLPLLAVVCSADTALAQGNTITVSPLSLAFNSGQGTPAIQTVTVKTTSGTQAFTATASSVNSFLSVFPPNGTAAVTSAGNVQVSISNPNLPVGTYTGAITITTGQQTFTVNVTYTVGSTSGGSGGSVGPIAANPTSLTFNAALGTLTVSQPLTISTTGAEIGITVLPTLMSGAGWLSVNPTTANISSAASSTVTVSVTPNSLPAGTYTGVLNVYQNGSATASLMIPVTLNLGTTTGTGNVTASPSSLSYSFSSGSSAQQSLPVQVTTTSNLVMNVTATTQVNQGAGWLSVNPTSINISSSAAAQFNVVVSPIGLASGQYTGTVKLAVGGEGTINIPVTVSVGNTTGSLLTATPNPMTFSIAASSTSLAYNQTLAVKTTSLTPVTYTATAATIDGSSWLSVNPASAQMVSMTSPGSLTVSVNATGLVTGTYSGSITLTPNDGSTALVVPVNVTVGSSPALTIAPSSLSFAYQTSTAFPPAQTLSFTSSGGMIAFSATPSTTTGGSWLVVSPQTGATSASGGGATSVTVQVNPLGLAAGTYMGSVNISASGASNPTQSIPVTLLVSSQPILALSNSSVTFNYQFGSTTLPVQQQVQVTSSGNPLNFTASAAPASGGNFLMVTPASGATPQSLSLSIIPSALQTLAPGTYSSTVTVNALGAGNSPVNLNVYLVIGNNTLLNPSQTSLLFNYEVGKAVPSVQTFSITSTGSPVNYTVAAASTNCGGNFVSATPVTGITPGSVAVAISTSGVVVGVCKGTITLTSSDANVGNSPLTIPVTLNVSNSPLLNVSPTAVNVSAQVGTSPVNQIVALTSTDPTVPLMFNVTSTTNNGTGWLLVGPTSGSTPNNLTLGFQTSGLGVGTYNGSITVTPTAAGSTPTVIPVTVVISTAASASASPASLTFNQAFGGTAPAAQAVQIASSTTGLSFSTSVTTFSGGNWLSVTPANGTTPGTIMISASAGTLGQGSYSGVVTVVIPGAANTPLNIPVTLTVGPAISLAVSPATVNFTYVAGNATAPAAQTVQVTSTGGNIPFAAVAASASNGLITVTPASGTTPGSISIGLSQTVLSTLAMGTYTGTVTLTSSSLAGVSQVINVTVTVQPQPTPSITSVVSSASNLPGAVSPGEIISVYGANIGPATAAGLQLTASGSVATILANTEVTFDGIASPLIYVSSGQINAIVPYEIAGRATTNVVVQENGVASAALQLRVTDTVPAIFSLSQTGNGQGAILNQNNTANGTTTPAAVGSVISIYATGEGALTPPAKTGSVTSLTSPYPMPVATPISLTIGGKPATILYAGEAPGLVSGVLQINAIVPEVGSGPQTVLLTVGTGTNMQQAITVAVQ